MNDRQIPRVASILIFLLFALIGVLVAADYGISWDEVSERQYGWDSLKEYTGEQVDWEGYNLRKYYGPFFLMSSNLISSKLAQSFPSWTSFEFGHLLNYATFLLSAVALCLLLKQFVSVPISIFTSLLFFSQPLLFGHSFINHKDIPFMSLFLVSFTFGMMAIRRVQAVLPRKSDKVVGVGSVQASWPARLSQDWRQAPPAKRLFIILWVCISIILIVDTLITDLFVTPGIERALINAYHGNSWLPFNIVFRAVAARANDVPLEAYLSKLKHTLPALRITIVASVVLVSGLLTAWFSPQIRSLLWDDVLREGASLWRRANALHLILLSALFSGLASSVRPLGFIAFLLVLVIALYHFKVKAVVPAGLGLLLLITSLILTWPALWDSPWRHFLDSLSLASRHPWRGVVLYRGELFVGGTLPWHFLPTLLLAQFTLPVYALAVLGLIAGLRFTKRAIRVEMVTVAVWFVLPMGWAIVSGAIVFDNFRQFLFTIPPVFLLIGIGLEHIKQRWQLTEKLLYLTGFLLLLPGLFGIIKLHPYEYVHYNAFAGGVQGAFRNYELDYWCTSFKGVMAYAAEELPPGSGLAVWGPVPTVEYYARHDLKISKFVDDANNVSIDDEFILTCVRQNIDLLIDSSRPLLYKQSIQGIPLAKLYGTLQE